jgi:hypothetical protein
MAEVQNFEVMSDKFNVTYTSNKLSPKNTGSASTTASTTTL